MTNWINTLEKFSVVIRSGEVFSQGEVICPNYSQARGVDVYRNNYRGNLHDALAGAYPVIRQLVGEQFFRQLARHYIEIHPSGSGNLHDYGTGMAKFLTGYIHTDQLAYLPDMARLEWAYHLAYFADDIAPFDVMRLAGVAPESYGELRWRLHPGCTQLISDYPISRIWQVHQQALPTHFEFDLGSGGESLLVYRYGLEVQMIMPLPGDYCWLERMRCGMTMGRATDETLVDYPDFNLLDSLRYWLGAGVLIDFDIHTEEK